MSRDIQANPRYYWAIINPCGHLWPQTCSYSRHRAIQKVSDAYKDTHPDNTWPCLYRRGWRAVKVTIRYAVRTTLPLQ